MKKLTVNNIMDVFNSKVEDVKTAELKGYELIEVLFCDNSGLGAEDEPALTKWQVENRLKYLIDNNNGTVYTTITNVGQFQIYLGVFKKVGKSKIKRISTNVFEYEKNGDRTIRLYDTDIVVFRADCTVINTDGHLTNTTKKWINKYINPMGYNVIQKNWGWYVTKDGDKRAMFDGFRLGID